MRSDKLSGVAGQTPLFVDVRPKYTQPVFISPGLMVYKAESPLLAGESVPVPDVPHTPVFVTPDIFPLMLTAGVVEQMVKSGPAFTVA